MLADMLCHGFTVPLLREVARGPLADALRHYDPYRLVDQLLIEAPPAVVGPVNAMRHLDFALTLPGDMLVKVDRASMAVALEVRPLFLHREVMELAAALPPAALVNPHAAKLALKRAVQPWLPEPLLHRRKQGFALPLPEWLGGDSTLRAELGDEASTSPIGELLDLTRIAALREAHAAGRGNFTSIVHGAFMLNRWFTRWLPN
jgi:asparagine synthase (glutamine-hydrolysing)